MHRKLARVTVLAHRTPLSSNPLTSPIHASTEPSVRARSRARLAVYAIEAVILLGFLALLVALASALAQQ